MSLEQAIIVGLCTAVATASLAWLGHMLVAYLQRDNERAKYFRERLLERYAELVALGAAELERAKTVESGMAIGAPNSDFGPMSEVEAKRHQLRLDLLRVSLQIRLYEPDPELAKRVADFASSQPFMAFPFPPQWGQRNYSERFDEYKKAVIAFEKQLGELVEAVLKQHAVQAQPRRWQFWQRARQAEPGAAADRGRL